MSEGRGRGKGVVKGGGPDRTSVGGGKGVECGNRGYLRARSKKD